MLRSHLRSGCMTPTCTRSSTVFQVGLCTWSTVIWRNGSDCNPGNFLECSWQGFIHSTLTSLSAHDWPDRGVEQQENAACCRYLSLALTQDTRGVLCPSSLLPHSFHETSHAFLSGKKTFYFHIWKPKDSNCACLVDVIHLGWKYYLQIVYLLLQCGSACEPQPGTPPSALVGKGGESTVTKYLLREHDWGLSFRIKACGQ